MNKSVIIGYLTFLIVLSTITFISINSNAQVKVYKIGEKGPAGGWIIYDKGNNAGGWRYLEAAPEDQGKVVWGCYKESIPGAKGTAIGAGKSNTRTIEENCDEESAAKLCTAYKGGGKNDWFLPSRDELNLIYTNLYKAKVGGFAYQGYQAYWSSSEIDATSAWNQDFFNGFKGYLRKKHESWVRAVRAF